jgi:hypothetical protein
VHRPSFGPTAPGGYWSSSAPAAYLVDVRIVASTSGYVNVVYEDLFNSFGVHVVRGGPGVP